MENRDQQNKPFDSQNDISKSQANQQPTGSQMPKENGQREPQGEGSTSFETGQADYGNAGQGDALTQQRTDVEGAQRQSSETGEANPDSVIGKSEDEGSDSLIDKQARTPEE